MKINHVYTTIISAVLIVLCMHAESALAQDNFTTAELCGSAMPYPVPENRVTAPDSLKAIMINHVGRHGARYMTSPSRADKLLKVLDAAEQSGHITQKGRDLRALVNHVKAVSAGKWGALDTIGEAEQRGIACRMQTAFPDLFHYGYVQAISSYVPRCVMSMYVFAHELSRLSNTVKVYTSEGRQNSALIRPFDLDSAYINFRQEAPYAEVYDSYLRGMVPLYPVARILGNSFPISKDEARELAMTEYGFLSGLAAMGIDVQMDYYLTADEQYKLWACNNLYQYLTRTATDVSVIPALVAVDLLKDIIVTTDEVVAGTSNERVRLRFGHAETLMPLLSLMGVPGCLYMTTHYGDVAQHWQNFHVVPMAANLQMILFQARSGRKYVRFDLNEVPVRVVPGVNCDYVDWDVARDYLVSCAMGF